MKRALLGGLGIGAAAVILVAAAGSLWWPYGEDQGQLAHVGDVILAGQMPHRDVWDNNSPGTALQEVALRLVGGRSQLPLRVLDLLYLGGSCLALYVLGRRLHSPLAGAAAAAAWAATYLTLYGWDGFWCTAQRDGWAAMLGAMALALAVRGRPGSGVVAGVLVGMAALFKPLYAGLLLPVLVLAWETQEGPRSARRAGAAAGEVVAGMALATLPVLLWLAGGHALGAAWEQIVIFRSQVYLARVDTSFLGLVREVGHRVLRGYYSGQYRPLSLPLVLLGAVGWWSLQRTRPAGRVALAWILPVGAMGALLVQGRILAYHWWPLLLSISLLGGVGFAALVSGLPRLAPRSGVALAVALGVAGAGLVPPAQVAVRQARYYWGAPSGERQRPELYADCMQVVAGYLRSRTDPGTPVQVWSVPAIVYFLADRPGATASPLGWEMRLAAATATDLHDRYARRFLAEMEAKQPPYFVYTGDELTSGEPLIWQYLIQKYQYERVLEAPSWEPDQGLIRFTVLRRRR